MRTFERFEEAFGNSLSELLEVEEIAGEIGEIPGQILLSLQESAYFLEFRLILSTLHILPPSSGMTDARFSNETTKVLSMDNAENLDGETDHSMEPRSKTTDTALFLWKRINRHFKEADAKLIGFLIGALTIPGFFIQSTYVGIHGMQLESLARPSLILTSFGFWVWLGIPFGLIFGIYRFGGWAWDVLREPWEKDFKGYIGRFFAVVILGGLCAASFFAYVYLLCEAFILVLFDYPTDPGAWWVLFPGSFRTLYAPVPIVELLSQVVFFCSIGGLFLILAMAYDKAQGNQKEEKKRIFRDGAWSRIFRINLILALVTSGVALIGLVVVALYVYTLFIYPSAHFTFGGGKPRKVDLIFESKEEPPLRPGMLRTAEEPIQPLEGQDGVTSGPPVPRYLPNHWRDVYIVHEDSTYFLISEEPRPRVGGEVIRIEKAGIEVRYLIDS